MSSDQSRTWPVAGDRVSFTGSDGNKRDGILAEVKPGRMCRCIKPDSCKQCIKYSQPPRGRVVRLQRDIQYPDIGVMVDYDKLARVPPKG